MKLLIFFLGLSVVFADQALDEFIKGSQTFTSEVYNQLLLDSNKNILVSPFSAETVLALTQSGAVGATGEEIRTSLHLPETKQKTEEAFRNVLPSVHSEHISLITANKIFVENGLEIKEDFQRVARDVYQAQFENVEFSESHKAADEINQWVEKETNNKIKNLVSPDDLDATTRLVLVNALYFQGNWSTPFNPSFTQKSKFYTSEKATIDTTIMYQESVEYNYAESEELDAQILEIPFQGKEASMVVVLPNKKEGISVLEKQIRNVLNVPKFAKEFIEVKLPKFKIESTIDFKDVLEKIGVHKAFIGGEADFSGIAGEQGDLFIAQAKQKTYIDVNEIGVEAAAATEIGSNDSLPPKATKSFIADHPFVFYIKIQDIVLFEGRVLVPEYK